MRKQAEGSLEMNSLGVTCQPIVVWNLAKALEVLR